MAPEVPEMRTCVPARFAWKEGGKMKPSDIRILRLSVEFHDVPARTPLKFGGVVVREAAGATVRALVENRRGSRVEGHGMMSLSNAWSWPSQTVPPGLCLDAMKLLCLRICEALSRLREAAHPLDWFTDTIEPECLRLAAGVSADMKLAEPMPRLSALVCAASFDAALHDAFGLANGIGSYDGLGPDHMSYDLSKYLGSAFSGKYPSRYLRDGFLPKLSVFHLVGGLDKLSRMELSPDDPDDGLPNCLADWVRRDGVYCLKIKLRGNDLAWDVERTLAVGRIAREELRGANMHLTADLNEMAPDAEYVVEYLGKVREADRGIFNSLLYIEQPTSRDLRNRPTDLRKAAAIKPIFADEALTDTASLEEAVRQGYSGAALKTCKGHSACLLMVPRLTEAWLPYAVQDLSLTGIALLQSAGLAARIHTVMGVEANGRQFFPTGSLREAVVHPGMFAVRKGIISTATLKGPGLGFQWHMMPQTLLPVARKGGAKRGPARRAKPAARKRRRAE
ncbi:MAG: hypothetical protein N3A38_05315 [Planctomycetota bacterium]|nr:hypothetical protein [Planctomycetota bacterium]